MKKGFFLVPLATIASAQDYQVHILQENENLSSLLHNQGYSPLYGKNGWVQKTLEMNHLTKAQAKEIKKGYPVILPSKNKTILDNDLNELTQDFISTQNSSVIRAGLFGKTISDHQKVFLDIDYYTNSIQVDEYSATHSENYGLGIRVEGKNDYTIGNLTYNHHGSLFVYSHGSGAINNSEENATSFEPTYQLSASTMIKAPELSFRFGPEINLKERSRLFSSNSEYTIGRDQTGWIGFKVAKIFEIDHLRYSTDLLYSRKVLQRTLRETDNFTASNIIFNTKINLSHDYDFGFKFNSIQYDNIGIKRENAFGINLSYNLK